MGSTPGWGSGTLLQYSYLENPMDRVAWQVTVHGVAKSQKCLSTGTENCLKLGLLSPVFLFFLGDAG